MALTHWAFLYTADGAAVGGDRIVNDNGTCKTVLIGVPTIADAVVLVASLVDEGVQLIELCGGFGPVGTAQVIAAMQGRVPVGSVGYGPESVDGVHALFA